MFDNIIICPWKNGQQLDGVQEGAYSISSFIKTKFEFKRYLQIEDDKDYTNEQYHMLVYQEMKNLKGNKLVIGGDHSVAIGSIFSSLYQDKNTCVIWIDAHADINTINSSISKNYHGMPLSFLCGTETNWKWTHKLHKLNFRNLFYFGIRDLDEYEIVILKEKNIKVLHNINDVFNVLNMYNTIHMSFDVDALDPSEMYSTGTKCESGIPLVEILDLFKKIKADVLRHKTINIDICEYNPQIGNCQEKQKSWKTLKNILSTLC